MPISFRRVRVLSVIDSLDAGGGAERSLAALAPALCSHDVELHVAYLRARSHTLEPALRHAGVTVHALVGRGGRAGNVARVARVVRRVRPDLVHTSLFEADQAGRLGARIARRPVVTSLVNVAYAPEQVAPGVSHWKYKAAQTLDIATARLARRFHANSAYVADVMAARLRIQRSRIDVVHRGRDIAALGRRSEDRCRRARASLGIDPEQRLVVAIGRQEWQKGHDVLLAAMPLVLRAEPGVVVAIAGRAGGQTERLRETIGRERLSGQVRLLGFRDDAPELLCAADVFAFPSRWEGLPGTVLEAMALEAPIVATDLPMTREVVTDDEAMLVPPEDPAALAAAILDCLHDRASARHRVKAARERVAHEFTIERSALGMLRFFERALGSSG